MEMFLEVLGFLLIVIILTAITTVILVTLAMIITIFASHMYPIFSQKIDAWFKKRNL